MIEATLNPRLLRESAAWLCATGGGDVVGRTLQCRLMWGDRRLQALDLDMLGAIMIHQFITTAVDLDFHHWMKALPMGLTSIPMVPAMMVKRRRALSGFSSAVTQGPRGALPRSGPPRFFSVQITKLQPHGAVRIIDA